METIKATKGDKNRAKDYRSGAIAKKKQTLVEENGRASKQRNTISNGRRREFHRVINKIRNLPNPNMPVQGTSRQSTSEMVQLEEVPELKNVETMSSGSQNTIAVQATNFKRYVGANGVGYINMGNASRTQKDND